MRGLQTSLVRTLVREALKQGADLARDRVWYFDTIAEANSFLDKATAQGWDDYGDEQPKKLRGGRCSIPNLYPNREELAILAFSEGAQRF